MGILDDLKNKAGELGDKAKEGLETARDRAEDVIDDAREKGTEIIGDARGKGSDLLVDAKEKAEGLIDDVQERVGDRFGADDTVAEPTADPAHAGVADHAETASDKVAEGALAAEENKDEIIDAVQEKSEELESDSHDTPA